jgi:hypothetical protein
MKTSTSQAVGFLITLSLCCITASSQTTAATNSPLNTVKGRISLKGQPVADVGIKVRLMNSNSARPPTYRGRSDYEGNYIIGNIPNGTYQVSPEAPEFWIAESSRVRVLILSDGESIENVDFALARGGVITGKVTTNSGNRPLIAMQVTLRSNLPDNQPATSETDDRGIYRIFGLPPGKYKVAVTPPRSSVRRLPPFDETFYPAATNSEKAEFVEVGEGAEVKGIDITVEMSDDSDERFDVSGRIVNASNDQPVPQMRLRLQRMQENNVHYSSETATSDANGLFKFEDLIPGKYGLVIDGPNRNDLRAENITFVVNDREVTDLLVKVARKASVSGIVAVEMAQSKTQLAQFGPLFLNAMVTNESSKAWAESARVSSDGTFQMFGLQRGLAEFSVGAIYPGGLAKGLSVARVERDGIAQSRGLEIKGEENITGVRVVLKYATGVIRGVVKLSVGELPASARLHVQIRPSGREALVQNVVVDARGYFVAEGLSDGTYEVHAILIIPGRRIIQGDTKQQVSVSEGAVSEVLLTVQLPASP